MFDYYDQQLLTPELREIMGKVLACQANLYDESQPEATPWFAVSLPDRAAAKLFEQHAEALNTYAFEQKTWEDGLIQKGFTIDEGWVGCENNYYSND